PATHDALAAVAVRAVVIPSRLRPCLLGGRCALAEHARATAQAIGERSVAHAMSIRSLRILDNPSGEDSRSASRLHDTRAANLGIVLEVHRVRDLDGVADLHLGDGIEAR